MAAGRSTGPARRRGRAAEPASRTAHDAGGEDRDAGDEDEPFAGAAPGAVPRRASARMVERAEERGEPVRSRARSGRRRGRARRRGRRGRTPPPPRRRRGRAGPRAAPSASAEAGVAPRTTPSPKPSARKTATSMPMAIATSSGGPVRDMAHPADNIALPRSAASREAVGPGSTGMRSDTPYSCSAGSASPDPLRGASDRRAAAGRGPAVTAWRRSADPACRRRPRRRRGPARSARA